MKLFSTPRRIRKRWTGLSFLLLIVLVFFIFKRPILQSVGGFLISTDQLQNSQAIFILSGSHANRGRLGAELYFQNWASEVYCTGENVPSILKAMGWEVSEAMLTRQQLRLEGVSDTNSMLIEQGTSTFEESEIILQTALQMQMDTIIVVSSSFHTRRIQNVFRNKFEKHHIELIVQGAPSTDFDEKEWWKSEEGLIACNNEYIKLLYYWFKY